MKKRLIGLLIILAIGGTTARAEMRMWTDNKGNTVEAEHINTLTGQIVLKTTKGKLFKISLNKLSPKDFEYIQTSIPPKFDIDVDISRRQRNTNSSYYSVRKEEALQLKMTLTKKSRGPSAKQFTAYLYLFSKDVEHGRTKVIDVALHDFSFGDQKEIKLSGEKCFLRNTKRDYYLRSRSGGKYGGYLVCITDRDNTVLAVEGSNSKFESKVREILGRAKGSTFDKKLEPYGRDIWLKNRDLRNERENRVRESKIKFTFSRHATLGSDPCLFSI